MKKSFSIITLICLALGIAFGLLLPDYVSYLEFIGSSYVAILKLFITPVIFTSIAYTIYQTSKKKSRLVGKSVLLFVLMFVSTFLLTSLIVVIIDPSNSFVFENVDWTGTTTSFNLLEMIINLFPKNINDIIVSPKIFAIIVFAYLFGKIGSLIKNSEDFFERINDFKVFIFKVLEYFMYVTPIAVFSLTATTTSKYGYILLGVGLKYILTAYLCAIICLFVIMILPVTIIAKMSPITYIKKVYKIWIMTITTCSSAATLPYTVKLCNEELGIPSKITDVVVPLGCTIHMCGGAVSFALLGLFCARLYNIDINLATYLIMIIASLLINMAAPGIPNGGIVIGATYLEMLGIPLGFIGFYSGIYKFLDMCYTSMNVTGDISANIILNELEK